MNTLEKMARAIRISYGDPRSTIPYEIDNGWHDFVPEARAALEAMREPGLAEHLQYEAYCDEPAAKDFRAMIDAILEGK